MAEREHAQWLVPTRGAHTLPAIEVLTGRGFITGKSGSGKSNTAGVIAEELLDSNYNLLIVDPEGEYYGLKEKYDILHVGNDDICDMQATPDDAEQLADLALNQNTPIILDVSDYLDRGAARELIANTVRELFRKEKKAQMPFLVMIEEMQEYLPQQGGSDELSEVLERVAKRGRKRGLGMLGMSQRPSSVDKDFITQCDWMVWHRLTWQNDINVVTKVLGSEYADLIENLDTGEGFLMTDWDEELAKVTFKRKRTHDAGATPGLDRYTDPEGTANSQSSQPESDRAPPDPSGVTDPAEPDQSSSGAEPAGTPSQTAGAAASTGDGAASEETASADDGGPLVETLDGSTAAAGKQTPAPDPSSPADHPGPADGQGAGATDRILNLDVDPVDGEDLGDLTEAELRERAERLHRENQILDDEVAELRTILGNLEEPPDERPTTGAAGAAGPDADASGAPATIEGGAGSAPVAEQDDRDGDQPATPPRPVPPEPPADRHGIAGNLIEFVYMLGYLLRSLVYRCRLVSYRLRYGRTTASE